MTSCPATQRASSVPSKAKIRVLHNPTHLNAPAAVHCRLQQWASARTVGGVGICASSQQLRHNGLQDAAAAAAATRWVWHKLVHRTGTLDTNCCCCLHGVQVMATWQPATHLLLVGHGHLQQCAAIVVCCIHRAAALQQPRQRSRVAIPAAKQAMHTAACWKQT
jgi:hypothetical protein